MAVAGRHTLRYRQSSDVPTCDGIGPEGWMGSGLIAFASRTPSHGLTAWGGRHRNGPTGGWAKGMPLKAITPSADMPRTLPLSTFTRGGSALGDRHHRLGSRDDQEDKSYRRWLVSSLPVTRRTIKWLL